MKQQFSPRDSDFEAMLAVHVMRDVKWPPFGSPGPQMANAEANEKPAGEKPGVAASLGSLENRRPIRHPQHIAVTLRINVDPKHAAVTAEDRYG